MKTLIQYTTKNYNKNNRIQSFLKEITNLSYYQQLEKDGIIWDLEVIIL